MSAGSLRSREVIECTIASTRSSCLSSMFDVLEHRADAGQHAEQLLHRAHAPDAS